MQESKTEVVWTREEVPRWYHLGEEKEEDRSRDRRQPRHELEISEQQKTKSMTVLAGAESSYAATPRLSGSG